MPVIMLDHMYPWEYQPDLNYVGFVIVLLSVLNRFISRFVIFVIFFELCILLLLQHQKY